MEKTTLESASQHYFGANAAEYNKHRHVQKRWAKEQEIVRALLMRCQAKEVLDMPVGTGRFFGIYKELGINAIGVDISTDMLAEARTEAAQQEYTIDLRQGSATALPVGDASVDAVVCVRFLNFVAGNELAATLAEQRRVTKKYIIASIWVTPPAPASKLSVAYASLRVRKSLWKLYKRALRVVGTVRRAVRSIFDGDFKDRLAHRLERKAASTHTVHQTEEALQAAFAAHSLTVREKHLIETRFDKDEYYIFLLEG